MGLFDKIREFLFGSGEIKDENGLYYYIKCGHCGAPIRIRVDRRHDLLRNGADEEEEGGETRAKKNLPEDGYTLHKEIMDGSCFRLIYATIYYDMAQKEISKEIKGGTFITWKEYEELTKPATPPEEQ